MVRHFPCCQAFFSFFHPGELVHSMGGEPLRHSLRAGTSLLHPQPQTVKGLPPPRELLEVLPS